VVEPAVESLPHAAAVTARATVAAHAHL